MSRRRPTAQEAALTARTAVWASLWGVPGLEARLQIRFSGRLRRSLGRCQPARGIIRLHPALAGRPALLEEILCHEAAHAAVHALHGRPRRPHGREWAALMRAAGYAPRVRFPAGTLCAANDISAAGPPMMGRVLQ